MQAPGSRCRGCACNDSFLAAPPSQPDAAQAPHRRAVFQVQPAALRARERDKAFAQPVRMPTWASACSIERRAGGPRARLWVHHQQARLEQVDVGGRRRARQAPGHARPAALRAHRQLPLQVAVVLWRGGLGAGSSAPEATPHRAPAAAAPVLERVQFGSSCLFPASPTRFCTAQHHSATCRNAKHPARSGVRQRSDPADRRSRCRLA